MQHLIPPNLAFKYSSNLKNAFEVIRFTITTMIEPELWVYLISQTIP